MGCIVSFTAAAECLPPATPILPDGAVATESDMIQAQQQVAEHSQQAEAYLECLEQEEQLSLADGTETEESKIQRDSDYQSMLETLDVIGEQYLQELKKFNGVVDQ